MLTNFIRRTRERQRKREREWKRERENLGQGPFISGRKKPVWSFYRLITYFSLRIITSAKAFPHPKRTVLLFFSSLCRSGTRVLCKNICGNAETPAKSTRIINCSLYTARWDVNQEKIECCRQTLETSNCNYGYCCNYPSSGGFWVARTGANSLPLSLIFLGNLKPYQGQHPGLTLCTGFFLQACECVWNCTAGGLHRNIKIISLL